ncbi:MAG: T9SS type A sorting domain-containing protein [Bacteroidales bacterium]|nr:T9SS type A sorting domain-containing protein [Bacteroidales bacterium]
MMKKNLLLFNLISGLLIFMFSSVSGQTFWGMTGTDYPYQGGTVFSFNAQTNQCTFEYTFKPSPVYDAFNVYEAGPGVYVGVCGESYADGIASTSKSYLYQYTAATDQSEIIAEFPGYFPHAQYSDGDADIIYFNNSIIGMMIMEPDSMALINYSVSGQTFQKIKVFNVDSWPGDGNFSYGMNNCHFSPVNDTTVVFSLAKSQQQGSSSMYYQGREFYSYNPQTGKIGLLFTTPSSQYIFPQGPFVKTADGRLFCQASNNIMELKLADSSYSIISPFSDGNSIVHGKLFIASDTTLVGLRNISTSGYLFEYDFKNNTLLKDYYISSKSKMNAFAKVGDSLYFYTGDYSAMIMAYKPGGDAPKFVYTLTDPKLGTMSYLMGMSSTDKLLSFGNGLSFYYPDKKAYVPAVRFAEGRYWSYKNGASPASDLLLASNGKLYGLTINGGYGTYYNGDGVLFEMDPLTKEYQVLVNFTGENGGFGDKDIYGTVYGKGQNNLLEYNGKIYGTTYTNGSYSGKHAGPGYGTIFTYDLNSTFDNFRKIFDFNDSTDASAGRFPMSGLTVGANNKLYGVSSFGGNSLNGRGVLYEIDPANNDAFRVVLKFPDTVLRASDNLVLADNGKFYGLATGSEFSTDPKQWAIREYDVDQGTFEDLFQTDVDSSEYNFSQILYQNNKLYGVVARSNNERSGYLFEFDLDTKQLTKKVIFAANGQADGSWGQANLSVSSKGTFWGTTNQGGVNVGAYSANTAGVIYEFNPTDGSFINHHSFLPDSGGKGPVYSTLVETKVDDTGIPENKQASAIHAFPNPTTNAVKFDLDSDKVQTVEYFVFDVSGKVMTSGSVKVCNYLVLSLLGYKPGVYFVKMKAVNKTYSSKIIKQ